MRRALEAADRLLDAEGASSDAWFAIAERLHSACRNLGLATHCLREWREPDDARANVDDRCEPDDDKLDPDERARLRSLRAGRRSQWYWPDADPQG